MILQPATLADEERFLRWRNDPDTRAASRHQEEVSPEEHREWLAHALASPEEVRLYVAEDAGLPVGVGRLALWPEGPEVSVTIAPEHRGRGLGRRLIHLLVAEAGRLGYPMLVAEVRGRNAASLSAFLQSGFRPSSPEAMIRLERPVSPGDACPWCAAGNPHHWMAEGSIGGPRARVALDMHEVEDTGGAGLRECLAANLLRVDGLRVRSCSG